MVCLCAKRWSYGPTNKQRCENVFKKRENEKKKDRMMERLKERMIGRKEERTTESMKEQERKKQV